MQIEGLSLEFESGGFEARLMTWYGRRIKRVTFSQDHKKHAKKRVYTEKREGNYIYGDFYIYVKVFNF